MRKVIIFSILVIVMIVTAYVYWFYFNPYSDGYREGVLQKFSRRGNVFKTYEGEMIQMGFGARNGSGTINANYFYFSVDDGAIADSLNVCTGKLVKLHYTQYRRTLPWRGEHYNYKNSDNGQYIVDKIIDVQNANMMY
jgi:hypothetical protein